MINKDYIGTNFDDFLEKENILEECDAVALERVFNYEQEK